MREQPTVGHVFNVDGAGADGNATPRFAAYGASKRGLAQLGKSIQASPQIRLHSPADGPTSHLYVSSMMPFVQVRHAFHAYLPMLLCVAIFKTRLMAL